MKKCFKCGLEENIISHHIKYNPEEIVDCCRSCHKLIHNKIRKENKCSLSVKEIDALSTKSSMGRRNRRIERIQFYTTLGKCIQLYEYITYDPKTGSVSYTNTFVSGHKANYIFIDEMERRGI